jgi:hypothetical protein
VIVPGEAVPWKVHSEHMCRWNRRPDLPGDAEKRRIDNDADGKRDGHSYEQARVVVHVKLSRNMSFHGGLLCFVDYIGQKITVTQKRHQR